MNRMERIRPRVEYGVRPECDAAQAALLELDDSYDDEPAVQAALEHVHRCPDCERALARTALVLSTLRRFADETAEVEPSPEVWPRVRAAVGAEQERLVRPSHSAGLVAGVALLLLLVMPRVIFPSTPLEPSQIPEATVAVPAPAGGGTSHTVIVLQAQQRIEEADTLWMTTSDRTGGDMKERPLQVHVR